MSGPAYSTHGVGLFNGITDAGSLIPVGFGAALIALGTMLAFIREQGKAATGQRPDFAAVITEALLCSALLMLHGWIARNTWTVAQTIATGIYPDTKLSELAKLLVNVAAKFQDYSFSLTSIGSGLKDSAVVMVALFAWILTLLAHWQLEVLQVCVYNVVFTFAPFLIGLSMFGFNGRKIWFSAIVEVSSWSITMAVVYRSIESSLFSYLKDAGSLSFTDTRFLDVISMLVFLSSLPFIVPIVTGRLLGSQALGELANATVGAGGVERLTNGLRSHLAQVGPMANQAGGKGLSVGHAAPQSRPGDK